MMGSVPTTMQCNVNFSPSTTAELDGNLARIMAAMKERGREIERERDH